MRFDVNLPDQVYVAAQKAAEGAGVSINNYVLEAVRVYLSETSSGQEPANLTPEQLAKVRKSQAQIKAGKYSTMEQVRADVAADREAWLAERPS